MRLHQPLWTAPLGPFAGGGECEVGCPELDLGLQRLGRSCPLPYIPGPVLLLLFASQFLSLHVTVSPRSSPALELY